MPERIVNALLALLVLGERAVGWLGGLLDRRVPAWIIPLLLTGTTLLLLVGAARGACA